MGRRTTKDLLIKTDGNDVASGRKEVASEEKRLLLHNDLDVAAALAELKQNFSVQIKQLTTENQRLESRVAQLEQPLQHSGQGGSVYVRWGRNVCPGNGTDLIYKGIMGGTYLGGTGGGANSLCLAEHPTWNKYIDGHQHPKSSIFGGEIGVDPAFSTTAFGFNYNSQDPPCARCHSVRANVIMIAGRATCYPGWTTEYTGYLVGGYTERHPSSDYICLDSRPEEMPHGLDPSSNGQHTLYFVETRCGSLPCPPYVEGREMACVVCSK